jgi:hypothetical protein
MHGIGSFASGDSYGGCVFASTSSAAESSTESLQNNDFGYH